MSNQSTPVPPPAPASPPRAAAPVQRTRTPMQFSMRSLMIVVTVVAVLAAILSFATATMTLLLIGLIALLFVGPVCLGTFALYTRGHKQTFFLGAFAGSLSSFYLSSMLISYSSDFYALIALSIVGAASTAACGLAALFTRRFLERRGWHLPSNRDDSSPEP